MLYTINVYPLQKLVPPLKVFSEMLAESHMMGPRDLQVNPMRQPDNDSEDGMRLLAQSLVASAISRATNRYLRELEALKEDVISTPVQSEELEVHGCTIVCPTCEPVVCDCPPSTVIS